MKEKRAGSTAVAILNGIAISVFGIALFLFIGRSPFKLYFMTFLFASLLFLVAEELKMVYNKKESKLLSVAGIVLIVSTVVLCMYSFVMTMQM